MKPTLYELVKLPSEEPVCYVGVYVLKWGKTHVPTVGFKEVETSAHDSYKALKDFKLWYQTLGHLNPDALITIEKIIPREIIDNMARAISKAEEK